MLNGLVRLNVRFNPLRAQQCQEEQGQCLQYSNKSKTVSNRGLNATKQSNASQCEPSYKLDINEAAPDLPVGYFMAVQTSVGARIHYCARLKHKLGQ